MQLGRCCYVAIIYRPPGTKFKEFKDGTWAVHAKYHNYIQYAMCEDLRPALCKDLMNGIEESLKDKCIDGL